MKTRSLGRLPALDGLRGIAVLAVVLFHYKTRASVPGGLFGVDLFFVLSGFLITALLVQEWQRSGKVDLAGFYRRRCLRLLPAAAVFVVTYAAIVAALPGDEMVGGLTAGDGLANVGLFFTQGFNWALIEDVAPMGGFTPLWSLAVEAQFYLVWPPLLIVMLRAGLRVPFLILACASLTLLSIGVPWFLADPSWHRVAFGTDFRAHQLLIGAIAGMLYAYGLISRELVRGPIFLSALAVSAVGIAYVFLENRERYLFAEYEWLMPLFALAGACVVIAAAFSEHVPEMRLLENPVLTWLGRRSYAVYLWHFPMGLLFASLTTEGQLLVGGAMTLAIAEVSYRYVEAPALRWQRKPAATRQQTPATNRDIAVGRAA